MVGNAQHVHARNFNINRHAPHCLVHVAVINAGNLHSSQSANSDITLNGCKVCVKKRRYHLLLTCLSRNPFRRKSRAKDHQIQIIRVITQFQPTSSPGRLLGVLGAERADGLSGAPDLELVNLLELSVVLLAVVGLRVVLERALGLAAVLDGGVEIVEDGLEGVLEALAPVDGTTTGSGGAGSVHVVHAVSTDQGVEGLGSLLDGLVEGLRGAVATLTENLVLGEEHAVNTTHQATTLAVQVGVDLLLEGGLVQVSGTDSDTEGDSLLLGLASDILEDSDGGVDTTALTEEGAHGAPRALRGDKDDVNVLGDLDLGKVLEDGGETVGEVEGLLRLAT
jgi:hypothetical protein